MFAAIVAAIVGLSPAFATKIADVRGVAYAAEVAPGKLFRGGRPDADGVAWLKARGIKTVINLRHYHGDTEERLVKAAGLRYERIALESSDAPSLKAIRRFLEIVGDPAAQPVYVHCKYGVDRTGTMMAVYRMEVDNWSTADAIAEMVSFGPHAMWRDLKAFVARYKKLGQ